MDGLSDLPLRSSGLAVGTVKMLRDRLGCAAILAAWWGIVKTSIRGLVL
jgi:hypothetical protein